jgi:hypothetical protein
MTDCQHEWDKTSIDGDPFVLTCLKCGQRQEAGPLTAAVIQAELGLGIPAECMPEFGGIDLEKQGSIAWNYESAYYHIYGLTPIVDDVFDDIFIGIPRSELADIDVQNIVDALNRIVSRKDLER